MNGRKIKGIVASSVLFTIMFFVGCGKEKPVEEEVRKPEINNGAIITEINDELKNYNMVNNKYVLLEEFKGITHYNKVSKNYIYSENGRYYASNGKEKVEVTGDTISNLELSPSGKYVSYFSLDDGYKFIVKNIEKNIEEEIKSKVSVSGNLIKWLNDNEIVYYGAGDDGKTGIYKYNFDEEKEVQIYSIEGAFVERLVTLNSKIYFVLNNFEDDKIIKEVDSEGNEKNIFTSDNKIISYYEIKDNELLFTVKEVEGSQTLYSISDGKVTKIVTGINEIKDVTKINNKYIILGKFVGNEESIYLVESLKATRVVYGFPASIGYDRAIVNGLDGKVLFVGRDVKDGAEESVYSIDGTRTVTSVFIGKGSVQFIKIN